SRVTGCFASLAECAFLSRRGGAHRDLHSLPTRRSSDLQAEAAALRAGPCGRRARRAAAASLGAHHRGAHGGGARRHLGGLGVGRSEEHTSELQSRENLVCRLLLEKKKSL